MALDFRRTFLEALSAIKFKKHEEFLVHGEEREVLDHSEIIYAYGDSKWKVVDLVNNHYSEVLGKKFDLYNWLHYNEEDELAYFLSEGGSNCLNHSQFKAPHKFHVWLGEKGFIVGIEQLGRGFPAELVHKKKMYKNEGAAFEFFDKCQNKIFFDDPHDAKMVFFEYKF
jgi:hypothetical protein